MSTRVKAPVTGYQVLALAEPSGSLSTGYPLAGRILRDLIQARFRVTEVDLKLHHVFIAVGRNANVLVYNSGKVVVQGKNWQFGHRGRALESVLPSDTIWQLRT